MKAAQVSHRMGHTSHSLFATSLGTSVIVHGLVVVWMLIGSAPSRALLTDLPAFHEVSLVDAPVSSVPEPKAVPEPPAVPEVRNPGAVRNAAPETRVPPPQARQATEVPEVPVEPPAPVAKPKPVEVPEPPPEVDTQVQQARPVKAAERRPAPTAAASPTPSPAEVAAAQAGATPTPAAAARPRAPAGRNSTQAAERAREAIENLRAQSGTQGTGGNPSPGGTTADMQEFFMRTYEQRVRARITNAWHLPIPEKMAQGLRAIALLTIDREGQVIRYQLTKSSGNPSFDASLRRAVQASSPLPELPETYAGEILEAEIHFTPPASS